MEVTTWAECAMERRVFLAGANPVRQLSFQPVAASAVHGGNDLDLSTLARGPRAIRRFLNGTKPETADTAKGEAKSSAGSANTWAETCSER